MPNTTPTKRDRRRKVASPPIWICLLLAAVWAGVGGLQLDRASRTVATYSGIVPEVFRSFAQSKIAAEALVNQRGDPLAEAKLLLQRRPIPAQSLTILSVAAAEQGDDDLAVRALTQAAQRGWREPIAQTAALQGAAQSGDWDSAALRMTALARTNAPVEQATYIAVFVAEPEGRRALANIMDDDKAFATLVGKLAPYETLGAETGAMFSILAANAEPNDCPVLSTASNRLLRMGRGQIVRQISLRSRCAGLRASPGGKLLFEEKDEPGPFDWIFPGRSSVQLIENDDGSIDIANTNPGKTRVAERYFMLDPGRYSLSASGKAEATTGMFNTAATGAEIIVECVYADPLRTETLARANAGSRSVFTVAEGCTSQRINVFQPRGRTTALALSLAAM